VADDSGVAFLVTAVRARVAPGARGFLLLFTMVIASIPVSARFGSRNGSILSWFR
jgi:hypothetical protein